MFREILTRTVIAVGIHLAPMVAVTLRSSDTGGETP